MTQYWYTQNYGFTFTGSLYQPIGTPVLRELPKGTTDASEPLQIIKQARITYADGKAGFMGAGLHRPYAAVDSAVCWRSEYGWGTTYSGGIPTNGLPPHTEGPFPHCTCGFYFKPGMDCYPSAWLIRAEHWGRVIRHVGGHRAQWQRVIAVIPPAGCSNCGLLSRPVTYHSAAAADGVVAARCADCHILISAMHRTRDPEVTLQELRAALAPVELEPLR